MHALGAYVAKWMYENGFSVKNQKLFKTGLEDFLEIKKRDQRGYEIDTLRRF